MGEIGRKRQPSSHLNVRAGLLAEDGRLAVLHCECLIVVLKAHWGNQPPLSLTARDQIKVIGGHCKLWMSHQVNYSLCHVAEEDGLSYNILGLVINSYTS